MRSSAGIRWLFFLWIIVLPSLAQSQVNPVQRVEPPNWWAGLHQPELELMVYGKQIADFQATVKYPGVRLVSQTTLGNRNYTFITLALSEELKPGTINLRFSKGKQSFTVPYAFHSRKRDSLHHQGFDASDVIYLMMPDRFANGDPSNDAIPGMLEAANRSIPRARHGGDFAGITKNLDYLTDLGVTAIWFTPIFENDMPFSYGAYHGYAATDMYKVDRRFGSNGEYKAMIDQAHQKGMKVIMDMIHNHVGDHHWWIRDLPADDWLNDFDRYGITNYRTETVTDPYVSEFDRDKLINGWFVKEMPDLNQKNPWLARYLIQNTLWWIEYSGIDGIRMDTYPYPDKHYMAQWAKTVLEEYPTFNIVGEAWVPHIAMEAYWQRGFNGKDGYESYLPSVTDFQIHHTLRKALNEPFGWSSGLSAMYQTLAQDFLYSDPMLNVIFLDNHDTERFISLVGEDVQKFKIALGYLLTIRGIPQLYYGSEIGMSGLKDLGDANVRKDFPGGWPGDPRSAFTAEGRTPQENELFNYLRTLLQWRKSFEPIHTGKFMHFIPENDTYVYFRYNEESSAMIAINMAEAPQTLKLQRFQERLEGYNSWKNVTTGQQEPLPKDLSLAPRSITILELVK